MGVYKYIRVFYIKMVTDKCLKNEMKVFPGGDMQVLFICQEPGFSVLFLCVVPAKGFMDSLAWVIFLPF